MGRVIKRKDRRTHPARLYEGYKEAAAALLAARVEAGRLRAESKDQVIDLALHLARRIVMRAVELDPSYLEAIYQEAIKTAGDLKPGVLYVNRDDKESLAVDRLAVASGLAVAEDPSLERSGCRVSVGSVEVSLTLDDALSALEQAMKGPDRV